MRLPNGATLTLLNGKNDAKEREALALHKANSTKLEGGKGRGTVTPMKAKNARSPGSGVTIKSSQEEEEEEEEEEEPKQGKNKKKGAASSSSSSSSDEEDDDEEEEEEEEEEAEQPKKKRRVVKAMKAMKK